jgi:hypothetical protein
MLNPNFVCVCNHSNKMHTTDEDALKHYNIAGRICVEYQDAVYINGKYFHSLEAICRCNNFVPDNLRTLELFSEKVV